MHVRWSAGQRAMARVIDDAEAHAIAIRIASVQGNVHHHVFEVSHEEIRSDGWMVFAVDRDEEFVAVRELGISGGEAEQISAGRCESRGGYGRIAVTERDRARATD